MMRFSHGCFQAFCIWFVAATALGHENWSFWVWHRRDPLNSPERQELADAHASLLWHIGELDVTSGKREADRPQAHWRWRDTLPEPGAIPVIRLNLNGPAPFQQAGLVENLANLADAQGRLQIDCDCPDRLLASYARFLADLRKRVPHLSASALAGWSESPAFGQLQESVERLDVMFYDLVPDPSAISRENLPYPLLNEAVFARQLVAWERCKVPWRAGLPNFARVTVFSSEGKSLGQIRNWTWDEVIFQPKLKFVSSPASGVVLLKAETDLVLAETPIKAGAFVSVRWVDRQTLSSALSIVKKSRAAGAVFFRLPDSTDPSGWSIPQINSLRQGKVEDARLELQKEGNGFVLRNKSEADLPPRLLGDGPNERGYALEIDAPASIWREALPGDFWRVGSHASPEAKPVAVPVPFATRLTFWFSRLRAGESLKTGLIQLAPDADLHQVRYRIQPGNPEWNPLE